MFHFFIPNEFFIKVIYLIYDLRIIRTYRTGIVCFLLPGNPKSFPILYFLMKCIALNIKFDTFETQKTSPSPSC